MINDLGNQFGDNVWLIEDLQESFQRNPESVSKEWADYFRARAAAGPSPLAQVEPRSNSEDAPSSPGASSGLTADVPNPLLRPEPSDLPPNRVILKGVAGATARNMIASLEVPTATSIRSVPMKLAIEERAMINNFLRRSRGGKVSFTHLIAYAMVKALQAVPAMNNGYDNSRHVPTLVENSSINLGLAIDLEVNGTRRLLVPAIKDAQNLNFTQFWVAYETLVHKARNNELTPDDFSELTATITNPGVMGTNASVPRLMPTQGVILGVGSIDYPAQFEGMSEENLANLGVSKVSTLTSTYDHRIIQGAQSGAFLGKIHGLLIGKDGFYEDIFEALRIPYPPLSWATDITTDRNHQRGKQARVTSLISAYRQFGHLQADIDPLEYRRPYVADLDLSTHGLTLWDLDRKFPSGDLVGLKDTFVTLRDILEMLRDSYCHTMGIEYAHIGNPDQRSWVRDFFEHSHSPRPREEQLRILDQLSEAEVFETFLQTKYVGQTRFSLEGAESLIVALAEICEQAADASLVEVCVGMPHRGRLNVLTNIVGKLYSQIFREFDNRAPEQEEISGDVKYHLGAEGEYTALSEARVKVSVAANPSHLEAVNPVLEGIARAKNDRTARPEDYAVLPVLMHGDASFAGQGVVYETLQMSQLRPYKIGGTIHLVVNNQVGFTTAPSDSRSSRYPTDVALAIQAPVIHVNGDDPSACARAAEFAFAFRQTFKKDVVIDMVCYRRRGHNEGDDPSFTQPLMYDLIEAKRPVRKIFTESLIGRGEISFEDAENAVNRYRSRLEEVFENVRNPDVPPEKDAYHIAPLYPEKIPTQDLPLATSEQFATIASVYSNLPAGFSVHPKVKPQLERRAAAIIEGPVDWATAELLAFGSLLMESKPVRLVGQDARRGTFSQRFGAIVDRVTNEAWVPLKHLSDNQAPFDIFDAQLSEYAALGFEYGYSVAAPESLVLWEAQYGDFANGAQTITDEFIASGFVKWSQSSGIVMLLPHGYEGQGPDHSSARLERYLELYHDGNMAITMPTTPASYFHLLRRHAYVHWHRPLIVATPKSMLRNKLAVSSVSELLTGQFAAVLPDPSIEDPSTVESVLLCAGKVRWSLVEERTLRGLDQKVAIIPIERIAPIPSEAVAKELAPYSHVKDIRFVQEEPANQGAWPFLDRYLPGAYLHHTGKPLDWVGVSRPAAAAPAVGARNAHLKQEAELLEAAFRTPKG